ncbi:hypothetical protein WN51_00674 [Melipona quadrifasciata]|uniref:Uncharacterized protein n=1 Tax=Melipona quadrifasciata TaxID=166423 RepID=A0A0N0BF23_9HYME|nr:hypothetical protein WN51_00674 [Melipona quadrifasciata]
MLIHIHTYYVYKKTTTKAELRDSISEKNGRLRRVTRGKFKLNEHWALILNITIAYYLYATYGIRSL